MPRIGNVEVSDDVVNALGRAATPAPSRPGLGEILSAAGQQAYGQLRYGLPYQYDKLTNNLTPENEEFYKQGLDWAQKVGNQAAPASVDDLTAGRVGIGRFVAENLTASLPQTASTIAATLGGAAIGTAVAPGPGTIAGGIGGLIGGIGVNIPQFSASNVARAVQEEGGLSSDAAERSLFAAPFQATADVLVERYLPGAEKVFGGFAAHQTGNFLTRTAKSIAKAGGTEAVSEASQQLGERYAAGLDVTGPDAAAEYVNAAVTAFAVGGVLGAGGGFRRTPALAKPAEAVTTEDMISHIDGILDGSGRAKPLALPAPTDVSVDAGGTARVNPAGRNILALPSPDQFQQPDVVTDTRGLSALNPDGQAALLATPSPGTPVPPAPLLALPAPTGEGSVLPAAPGAVLVDSRGLSATGPDAQTALLATPSTAPPTFSTQLDDLKKGLRGGFVQKLDAADPRELLDKVYTEIFENQNTAANVTKFAQRVGLLDDKLSPTPLATEMEQQRAVAAQPDAPSGVTPVATASAPTAAPVSLTPAAPDPGFKFNQLLGQAGIKRISEDTKAAIGTPVSLDDARQKVFTALAGDTLDDTNKRGAQAAVTQTEKLAQHLGLITNDDARDITPLGRKTYLATPDGVQAVAEAAVQQGYTGPKAAIFTSGVQSVVNGIEASGHSSFENMAAYQAGKVFAQDFVEKSGVTAAQTNAIAYRKGIGPAAGSAETTENAAREQVKASPLTPAQIQARGLHAMLDAADLSNVPDTEVGALRRMVRDGASPEEVGAALQAVQGGKVLFNEPAGAPTKLAPLPGRGQPRFKELNNSDTTTRTKAASRLETEKAVREYTQRGAIREALTNGEINVSRADKLNDMLDDGRIDQVEKLTTDFGAIKRPAEFKGPLNSDLKLEAELAGKSFHEVLGHVIATSPSKAMRSVLEGVQTLAKQAEKAGHKFDFKIAQEGDIVPRELTAPRFRALTSLDKVPPAATTWFKSSQVGGGLSHELVGHEMVHAVTMAVIDAAEKGKVSDPTVKQAVEDLNTLRNDLVARFNDRVARGVQDQFEDAYFKGDNNTLRNNHEVLAWGLTNPSMQEYLSSIPYGPQNVAKPQTMFGRLLDIVRKLLGLKNTPTQLNALNELVRVSNQLFSAKAEQLEPVFATRAGGGETAALTAPLISTTKDVTGTNETTQKIAELASRAAENIPFADLGVKARRAAFGLASQNQLDRLYGKVFPGMVQRSDALRKRDATFGKFAVLTDAGIQQWNALLRTNEARAKDVAKLMMITTENQVDPDRAFADHEPLKDPTRVADRARAHADAVKLKNDLSRGDGAGIKVFNDMRALNEAQNYATLSVDLHALIDRDAEWSAGAPELAVSPMDRFLTADGVEEPAAARDFWSSALADQMKAVQEFVARKKGEVATGTPVEQRAAGQHLSPIEDRLASIHQSLAGMARAPYFHLGRYGDQFGSAVIRTNADGTVDTKAQEHVAKALAEAGFGKAQISTDNTQPRFALRFDTKDARLRFNSLMADLLKQGYLQGDDGGIKSGPQMDGGDYGVLSGPSNSLRYVEQQVAGMAMFQPDATMSAKERASLEQQKQALMQAARDLWIASQPDQSLSKVMATRYTKPGFDPDMIRNFAQRQMIGARALAGIATSSQIDKAYNDMRAKVLESHNPTSGVDSDLVTGLMSEMRLRDARNPINPFGDTLSKLRGFSHAYHLGFSPAYGAIQLMQVGTNALPELAKSFGYNKSFHALRRALAPTLSILNAARQAAAEQGWRHSADLSLTENVIKNAKLSPRQATFLRHMIATGSIDIGFTAHSVSEAARTGSSQRGNLDTALKFSAAMGAYTETASRLITALAAHEMHTGDAQESAKFAQGVLSNAMFDYQSWNTARLLGRQGFLGPVTPLVTQFMQYSAQMTEKLYSEVLDATGKVRAGESVEDAAARRAGARTFLLGHLTAITALAGTLGLPFASAFGAVLEKLVNTTRGPDEPPFDATVAWRNFLASVLGKDMGEVVARGAPRALGFDISARVGEQNLLPFSDLLTDKRSWREATQDSVGRSVGAAPDMLLNLVDAGEKFGNGDLMGGLIAGLPVQFRNVAQAYRMTTDGYIDTKGNKLPMTPGTSAILWQLLGVTPSEKAEYSEARGDQQSRRVQITAQAQTLRNGIVRAMTSGDQDRARELVQEAQKFDKANPAYAVVPSLTGALQRQQQSIAQARALRTPVGVQMDDLAAQRLTRYANIDYVR